VDLPKKTSRVFFGYLPGFLNPDLITLITSHMLVWKAILVAVFSLSSYRYLSDSGTNWREILHDGTYQFRGDLLHFWGGNSWILRS